MNKTLAIFLLLLNVGCKADADDLSGDWVSSSNTKERTFTIKLEKMETGYVGSYCAVAQSGNRIDCAVGSTTNFKFTELNREFEFTTNRNRAKMGKAQISESGRILNWVITEKPDGECYAPTEASLSKN